MHALISSGERVDLTNSTPLGNILNEDNVTSSKEKEFIKFRKESLSKKRDSFPIKLGRKEIHQGEIRF